MGETFACSKSAASINHYHPVIQRPGKSGQRNSNMPGSYNYQRRWGLEPLYEDIKSQRTFRPFDGISMSLRISTPDRSLTSPNHHIIPRPATQRPSPPL